MTRDFNRQRRDDVRPSSRNSSSNRNREEHPSRPPRPRLNREAVDRAWESGASHEHADYRTRGNNRQPRRDGGRYDRDQYSDHRAPTRDATTSRPPRPSRPGDTSRSRNYRGYPDRSESFNRSGRDSRFDRSDRNSRGYSERWESSNRSDRGDRSESSERSNRSNRFERSDRSERFDRSDRSHTPNRFDRPGSRPPRPGFRGDTRPYERDRYRGYDNRDNRGDRDNRDNRDNRGYRGDGDNRDNRDHRANEYRDNRDRQPREFERDTRPPRSFGQSRRPYREREEYGQAPYRPGRGRPEAQGDYAPRRQDFNRRPPQRAPQDEQFEGDYERFNSHDGDEREEKPAPHKDAQFRAEIAEEVDALVKPVTPPPAGEITHGKPGNSTKNPSREKKNENESRKKARAGSAARSRKPGGKGKKAAGPDSGELRPSQRGFKWPTP